MEEITTRLIHQRDIIKNFVKQHTKNYIQTTHGELEQIPKKGFFKFLKEPSIYDNQFAKYLNSEYKDIRFELSYTANQIRKMLNK